MFQTRSASLLAMLVDKLWKSWVSATILVFLDSSLLLITLTMLSFRPGCQEIGAQGYGGSPPFSVVASR